MTASALTATIWKIDRFATHDGPGIRTNIYFKGCPLRCLWCANPEGQDEGRELGFSESKCTDCGLCYDCCPQEAILAREGIPVIDSARCDLCGQCVNMCPTEALYICGDDWSLSRVMDVIEKDRHIYRKSGGGITCTGGEPLLQMDFLQQLLAGCSKMGIHVALETCGHVDAGAFRKILSRIEWLFFDLKHLDSLRHRQLTGQDNSLILNNLQTASHMFSETGQVLVIRQVIVPGSNDGDNIRALVEFARTLPHVNMIELLPYHAYGLHKYGSFGREYPLKEPEPHSEDRLSEYKELVERQGIQCRIGGI